MPVWVLTVRGKQQLSRLRAGDLLFYGQTQQSASHVAFVYGGPTGAPGGGARPDCDTDDDGTIDRNDTCRYRILHASGDNWTQRPVAPGANRGRFNRKVVINTIGLEDPDGRDETFDADDFWSGTLANPVSFGRVKLWD